MENLEPLYTRSDGLSETRSGLVAVHMTAYSGSVDGKHFFRYRPNMAGSVAVVEWGEEDEFALFPMATSVTLIERGYAKPISAELALAYNESLGKRAKGTAKPKVAATPDTPAAQPAAPAPAAPPWAPGATS